MAKTKISEFSATPGNNTDIDGINIAEGCAPSGINDAIRELMAQLKDWQAGTSNDPYVVGSSGSLTLSYGTANGVPYLNGSKVVTSGSALTFDGTNFATTGSVTSAGSSNSGNLTFTGTGNRITGDFSNGTVANRTLVQSSTTNGSTSLAFIPNGTSQFASVALYASSSDPANTSFADLSISGSGNFARIRSHATGTGTVQPLVFDIGNSERMRIDTSGNVGIGTSSPGSNRLYITAPDGTAPLTLNSAGGSDATRALNFNVAGDNYGKILVPSGSGGAMAFWTGGANAAAERARIDSSGNLLVGTTSSTNAGRITAASDSAGSSYPVYVNNTNTGSSSQIVIDIARNGTRVGSISNTNTATAYATSSDYRLKENIQPMTGALAKVAALKPVTYTWKADGSAGEGFIAHELAEVCPQAVTGEKDAVDSEGKPQYQGIDVSFLVGTLTAALQEAHGLIKDLQSRVDALEAK